jgi:uncharacterized protein (DUF2236 family)
VLEVRLPRPPGVDALGAAIADPLAPLRDVAASGLRSMLASPSAPPVEHYEQPAGDPGWFGPGSMTWRVHGDRSMFVGGIRALLLQTMHPLAMAGVADHSDYRSDPLGRLQRTGAFIGATTFGGTEQAEQAVAMVRAVHRSVAGHAPDGRPYAAQDPDLLTWVHAAEVGSFLAAQRRYGAVPLGDDEADRYLDEVARVALELGAAEVPRSRAELRAYFRRVRPELRVGRQARDAVRWLMAPPLPLPARGPYAVLFGAAVGLLPRSAQWSLRLWSPPVVDPLVVRPATTALLAAVGWATPVNPALAAARRRVGADDR